jgi:hypothetical protein
MDQKISLSSMPMPMRWDCPPERSDIDGVGQVRIASGPRTDLFVDPGGEATALNAPRLIGRPPEGDFQFSARVTVDFAGTFDAGVLLVWADESRWAKLCFERSPAGENMLVSVVTRRCSDDANGFVVNGRTAWLRVSRLGRATAFHASLDGRRWQFVRYFDLGAESVRVGFESQSPMGSGCVSTFEDVRFVGQRLADLRDGS